MMRYNIAKCEVRDSRKRTWKINDTRWLWKTWHLLSTSTVSALRSRTILTNQFITRMKYQHLSYILYYYKIGWEDAIFPIFENEIMWAYIDMCMLNTFTSIVVLSYSRFTSLKAHGCKCHWTNTWQRGTEDIKQKQTKPFSLLSIKK